MEIIEEWWGDHVVIKYEQDNDDFIKFDKIQSFDGIHVEITQKINGTNAQIFIYEDENGDKQLKCGSRERWLSPGKSTDNFGFCEFVYARRDEFIDKLGLGRHYGEWAGPGIQLGEGLSEKQLFLFDWKKFKNLEMDRVSIVPILFSDVTHSPIARMFSSFDYLRNNGSFLSPGFMNVEGIVIKIGKQFFKKVFNPEETKWTGIKKEKITIEYPDISHLLQPIRLNKILFRDSALIEQYPQSLNLISIRYFEDLMEENQIQFKDEDDLKLQKKALGRELYSFIKSEFMEMGNV